MTKRLLVILAFVGLVAWNCVLEDRIARAQADIEYLNLQLDILLMQQDEELLLHQPNIDPNIRFHLPEPERDI